MTSQIEERLKEILRVHMYSVTSAGTNPNDSETQAVDSIMALVREARIDQAKRLDPYIDYEFRKLYEQELDELSKALKGGGVDE